MFHREMLYAAYSAHVNPFESAIAAEFGFKNLANSSLQLQFHRGHQAGGNSRDGSVGKKKKKRKGDIAVGKKKKKKNSSRRNTRINECAEARRLRRQIVSRAQSTYGRDAADGTGDTRVRSSRRRKWTGRGGLVSRAPPEHRGKGGVPCDH